MLVFVGMESKGEQKRGLCLEKEVSFTTFLSFGAIWPFLLRQTDSRQTDSPANARDIR